MYIYIYSGSLSSPFYGVIQFVEHALAYPYIHVCSMHTCNHCISFCVELEFIQSLLVVDPINLALLFPYFFVLYISRTLLIKIPRHKRRVSHNSLTFNIFCDL